MPVRDVLWACPLCRTHNGIRPAGRQERCAGCGAVFRRGRGARIVASRNGSVMEQSTEDWLKALGPPVPPLPGPGGVVLGPETVRVKFARSQDPLLWRGHMLGFVESYAPVVRGTLTLRTDALHLDAASTWRWTPADIRGVQPASSSIQLMLGGEMLSVKFLEGSVRLWTAALTRLVRQHHAACGREVIELQPYVRTRDVEAL